MREFPGTRRRSAAMGSSQRSRCCGSTRGRHAAPGNILPEMRGGEMGALREIPFAPYCGSDDATPLFVLLAGLYVERTGDDDTLAELWPAIEAALAWIDGAGDPDCEGFVEYQR